MTELSYKDAGVDIDAADAFVHNIARLAKNTHTPGVVPNRAEYAGLFRPQWSGMKDPLIAATCDGVGTKLLVARACGQYTGLGQDLVAMNVNDLLPAGARPLFFLDYIATGKLDPVALQAVVAGIAEACRAVGCALLGGETAEMPGVYGPGDFDLAGFAVGLVDGGHLPDPKKVAVGDQVLGFAASGVHSNGLSLARKALLQIGGLDLQATHPALSGRTLGEELLIPTALYVRPVHALLAHVKAKASAHITGGGLTGRASRLLQPGQRMRLFTQRYPVPPIFDLIAEVGGVTNAEMHRTFNMGLGYMMVVEKSCVDKALKHMGNTVLHVGEIVAGDVGVDFERA